MRVILLFSVEASCYRLKVLLSNNQADMFMMYLSPFIYFFQKQISFTFVSEFSFKASDLDWNLIRLVRVCTEFDYFDLFKDLQQDKLMNIIILSEF